VPSDNPLHDEIAKLHREANDVVQSRSSRDVFVDRTVARGRGCVMPSAIAIMTVLIAITVAIVDDRDEETVLDPLIEPRTSLSEDDEEDKSPNPLCPEGGGNVRSVPCEPVLIDDQSVNQSNTCGTGDGDIGCVPAAPPPTEDEQTVDQSNEAGSIAPVPCAQWDVTGSWSTSHSDGGYHPTFDFAQSGTTIGGTATLPGAEWQGAGYGGPTGSLVGSMVGDQLNVTVTWTPKPDQPAVSGVYTATIAAGGTLVDGHAGPVLGWLGGGPAVCVRQG
jgi:hypothetical protein